MFRMILMKILDLCNASNIILLQFGFYNPSFIYKSITYPTSNTNIMKYIDIYSFRKNILQLEDNYRFPTTKSFNSFDVYF